MKDSREQENFCYYLCHCLGGGNEVIMKKNYEKPCLEEIYFQDADIITASGELTTDPDQDKDQD